MQRSWQTVQTQSLEEQSDQELHCLPFSLYPLDPLLHGKTFSGGLFFFVFFFWKGWGWVERWSPEQHNNSLISKSMHDLRYMHSWLCPETELSNVIFFSCCHRVFIRLCAALFFQQYEMKHIKSSSNIFYFFIFSKQTYSILLIKKNEPPVPPPFPPPPHLLDEEQQECPHCFLTPCATSHNHYWLGEGQSESRENHGVRKIKYRSYWKFINNSGGWNDNRYLLKKVAAGGQVNDKHELMPSCVSH